MTEFWIIATLWLGLALIASLISSWLKLVTAMSEIVIGLIAQLIIGVLIGATVIGADESWVKFLASTGAIMLTFLAGAEVDPQLFREKWKEASAVGLASFIAPLLICTAAAYYGLHWSVMSSWLAGIALSTTSVAVLYLVTLESGLNKSNYGKMLLASCFITDLGAVIGLGIIFAPFTYKTAIFVAVSAAAFVLCPMITPKFFRRFGNRPSELETKYLLTILFALGALATWADSEAVLPAYLIGMALAGTVGKDHQLIIRLRTMTFGFLTPFYFIRAGSFVSIPAIMTAPLAFIFLLLVKIFAKTSGVYPVTRAFGLPLCLGCRMALLISHNILFWWQR